MSARRSLPPFAKYPSTPYWPWSPTIGRGDAVHAAPERFVGQQVVATEKLDGGNTLLHRGGVYARNVAAPSDGKWMAMAKKHHAWKVAEPNVYLYGEDIYATHSIAYDAVLETETFHAFALRDGEGAFAAFAEDYAKRRRIPVVPVLYRGRFQSVSELGAFMGEVQREPSALGGEREGASCAWRADSPPPSFQRACARAFARAMCKPTSTWRRRWQPCRIKRPLTRPLAVAKGSLIKGSVAGETPA